MKDRTAITVQMERELAARLTETAERNQRSIASEVRYMLMQYLGAGDEERQEPHVTVA